MNIFVNHLHHSKKVHQKEIFLLNIHIKFMLNFIIQ